MINKKSSALLVIVVLFMSACMASKQSSIKENNALPQWYINTPNNTNSTLYGAGVANSIKDAKNDALNNMSASLLTSISSDITTKTSVNSSTNSYNKNVLRNVNVKVSRLDFTNAKIENNKLINNEFYILMSVNRQELYNQKFNEFKSLDESILRSYSLSKNSPSLEKIYILDDNLENIDKAKKSSFLLYAIKNSFDYLKYYKNYDVIIYELQKTKNDLIIKLQTNSKYGYFKDELGSLLNKNKYRISSINNDVTIKLNNKIRYSIAKSWHIAKVSTSINVISNNKAVTNHIINTIGRSSSSKDNALASASRNFQKEIISLGVNKILFNK